MNTAAATPTLRRGTPDDTRACHELLWLAATDLGARRGAPLDGSANDWWEGMAPIHAQLAASAAEWWVAAVDDGGGPQLVGYARSVERGGLFELTEFFVRPGLQGAGTGRQLLERTFPPGRGEVRSIIATTDERALRRYYQAGVVARFPFLALSAEPAETTTPDDLRAEAIHGEAAVEAVLQIERTVLGYPRGADEIAMLLGQREGWLFRRASSGDVVGYGFVGLAGSGPIATLGPADLPAVLLHLEGRARALGIEKFELEVPAVAETAVRHLLERGFRISPWQNLLMSDRPFGQFDRYIGMSPPIVL